MTAQTATIRDIPFKEIGEALSHVQDPEIHMSVTELGLVYGAEVGEAAGGKSVKGRMSLTSPAFPCGAMLLASVHGALAKIPGVRDVDVDLTFQPSWDPRTMASEEAKDQLGIY